MLRVFVYMCRYLSRSFRTCCRPIRSILLLALRRFAARRGPVSIMYSDNAQTFHCIDRHLRTLQADCNVHDLLTKKGLLWIFSASLAPWWGGFWERMVRRVKDLLRRSNGRACSMYHELEVILIDIESVINARPLSYIDKRSRRSASNYSKSVPE